MPQQASSRQRCLRACEQCKRRKERCNGSRPCLLCARRGRPELCSYGDDERQSANDELQDQTSPRLAKRRKVHSRAESASDSFARVPLTTLPRHEVRFRDQRYYTGSSGTMVLLGTVGEIARARIGQNEFVEKARGEFLVEDIESDIASDDSINLTTYEAPETLDELLEAYLTTTRGIYDLLDETELHSALIGWRLPREALDSSSAIPSLVLAIGAQQRRCPGDLSFAKSIFNKAYHTTIHELLRPPSVTILQALILVSLYLFMDFRRNTAFTVLGAAIRAAETMGLRYDDHGSVSKSEYQMMRTRAWKCLRILDVSSCASLGRVLATKASGQLGADFSLQSQTDHDALADQVDTAGLHLCNIAETILIRVHEEDNLTVDFARSSSQKLREWAQALPDIMLLSQDDSEYKSSHLSEQLCLNHLTCAYYWTIILLTRPFLEHVVSGEQAQQGSESSNEDFQIFIDACIHSAIRCLDATGKLMRYSNLPKRLYLINNTTLVSALVLGLASFADASEQYPLVASINKAEAYLSHVSRHDPQAQLYLNIIISMKSAIDTYRKSQLEQNLQQRSAYVDQLFGSVVERGKASCSASNVDWMLMTPSLDGQDSMLSPSWTACFDMWDELRAGTALPAALE